MNTGIGLSETLFIAVVILIFFGSEQLPKILKQIGRFVATIKLKTNEVMSEIRKIGEEENKTTNALDTDKNKRTEIRRKYKSLRLAQSAKNISEKSDIITQKLIKSEVWKSANNIFIYLSVSNEVQTDEIIRMALSQQKRVAVPYIDAETDNMNMSEINKIEDNFSIGKFGIREPKIIKKFYKSDLDLIICPGVAFDTKGNRIGFGRGYYDKFLKDIQGEIPIIGIAFDLQITKEYIPVSYTDVPMDIIITETRMIETEH